MKRREFIAGLGSAAACPLAAHTQQPTLSVIGILNPNPPDTMAFFVGPFLEGLKEGGYVEGRNAAIEYRSAESRNDRLPLLANDLVQRQVKVIVAFGAPAAVAAKTATSIIPIVFQSGVDPITAGLVARLNRPGENVTGVTNFSAGIAAKRLSLLHQIAPRAVSIGVLVDPTNIPSQAQVPELQEAAEALNLRLTILNASTEYEIDTAFATLVQQRIGALLPTDASLFNARREQLVTLARFNAIPAIYTFREFVTLGGLMSYASSIADSMRRTGNYVARILNGDRPGDLPVQLPTKFELAINLKTAKALGLSIPPNLLALADEVIE